MDLSFLRHVLSKSKQETSLKTQQDDQKIQRCSTVERRKLHGVPGVKERERWGLGGGGDDDF